MARNTHGGGANTNYYGLAFEQETSLEEALVDSGYRVSKGEVFLDDELIAISAGKYRLYKNILEPNGIDYRDYISKQLLPDEALLNLTNNTIYIIEKKFQHGAGSVDEKLQTCDFKKKQYKKLFDPLRIEVEYYYVLNDYFDHPQYNDVFEYIESVGCRFFFNEIPIDELGLPR